MSNFHFEVISHQFSIIYGHAPKFVLGIKKKYGSFRLLFFHLAFYYLRLGYDCKNLLDKKDETWLCYDQTTTQ